MPASLATHGAPGIRTRIGRVAGHAALALAIGASACMAPAGEATAQQRMSFIRDAEIEGLLRDYATPVLRAAGLGQSNIQVMIVNSSQFNAFVMDGRRIFINAGVLMQAGTPNEVIGVLAHEAGHIAGGHLARLRNEMRGATAIAILSALLGAGAMVAGASSGAGTSSAEAGQAIMMGGQHMAQRSLLSYQRGEEQAADRAAVNYLTATGQSAKGMLVTFSRFADQSMFTDRYADPYSRSHPMPRDRIASLESIARQSPHFDRADSPGLQARHDLAKAKLAGHLEHPSSVQRRYQRSDQSLPARYARAIAEMRTGNLRAAIQGMDALIQAQPDNAWFREAKGEMLIRSGRPGEALEPLRRATSLQPDAPLVRITLGHALVATEQPGLLDDAIGQLNAALQREPEHAGGYRQLAIAYGRAGRIPEADLATAQGHMASGDHDAAKSFAQRAKQALPPGSPAALRADDILNYDPPDS